MKHNKKRNTAFLYESLVKELTKAIVRKKQKERQTVIEVLREFFYKGSVLNKELSVYNSILENKHKMTRDFSIRFLHETKRDFFKLDRKEVFNTQTKLIESINKKLSSSVFRNFVSNYKDLATVGQWFMSDNLNAKSRLLVESKALQLLTPRIVVEEKMQHMDNLTYRTFVEKFNETYKRSLGDKQKNLLTNYIVSFSDNGLGLKSFMNEEIGRLKKKLENVLQVQSSESSRKENIKKVLLKLEGFSKKPIDEEMVKNLFYIQDLVEEMDSVD
tara:strand:+ start:183 stop:1001 length:819 start_codon:yes stop_codon:yes gene_type:complete